MHQTWHLYSLFVKAAVRRLRYDFVREFVVLLCAILLAATFVYMFNDFVNEQIGRVSSHVKRNTLYGASYLLLALIALWQSKKIRHYLFSERSLVQLSRRLGEPPATPRLLACLIVVSFYFLTTALTWIFIQNFLTRFAIEEMTKASAVFFVVTAILSLFGGRRSFERQKLALPLKANTKSKSTALVSWRLQQMVFRNRPSLFALFCATLLTATLTFSLQSDVPEPAYFLFCYLIGFFCSLPIYFQLSEDLKMAWAERSMGISHGMILGSYKKIGFILVLPSISVFAVSAYLQGMAPMRILQFSAISYTPIYLAPVLMFQIDANRPVIQVITAFFIGLFIATGIFVHIAAIILWPGFGYYALASQEGRYYRC